MKRSAADAAAHPKAWSAVSLALRGRHLLALDLLAIALSYVGSLALRFDPPSALFNEYVSRYLWVLPVLIVVRLGTFVAFGLYQRVWRYASVAELQAIVLAVSVSSAVAYAVVYAVGAVDPSQSGFPRTIPVVDTLLNLALIGGLRFSLLLFRLGRQGAPAGTRAIVVGAGSSGVAIARQVRQDPDLGLQLVGFVDDAERKGHRLLGLPVLGRLEDLEGLIRQKGVGTVLFALPTVDGPTLRRYVRVAERHGARSLTIPSVSEVITGQVSSSLREVQVDDLLRRSPARIDLESIRELFAGRSVLITGAGGSIGSELARQIARYEPRRMYLVGKGEGSVYDVLESLAPIIERRDMLEPVILDVRSVAGVRRLFRQARPDVVFHAAAHKHVHFMERYPDEAVTVNVFGTRNVLAAAEETGVESFVLVSTDKAVQPTNVMGATKRVAELLLRDARRRTGRAYALVRFGNVLSSRGSVLPRFRRQLADGGPITVTHPDARRYFMTVNEAVQLILQAAAFGRGGETFVLDMGEPVRIEDLARDLIELHGLVPGRDIKIAYTGLLPGEKLDESLFTPDETPRRSAHDSIWMAASQSSVGLAFDELAGLERAVADGSTEAIIGELRRLVPDYRPAVATLGGPR